MQYIKTDENENNFITRHVKNKKLFPEQQKQMLPKVSSHPKIKIEERKTTLL